MIDMVELGDTDTTGATSAGTFETNSHVIDVQHYNEDSKVKDDDTAGNISTNDNQDPNSKLHQLKLPPMIGVSWPKGRIAYGN